MRHATIGLVLLALGGSAHAQCRYMTPNTDNINIRSGPGKSFQVIGTISSFDSNNRLQYCGRIKYDPITGNPWLNVRSGSGPNHVDGYVSLSVVTAANSGPALNESRSVYRGHPPQRTKK